MINLLDKNANNIQNRCCQCACIDKKPDSWVPAERQGARTPESSSLVFSFPATAMDAIEFGLVSGSFHEKTPLAIISKMVSSVIQRLDKYRLVKATMAGWKRMDGSGRTGAKAWVVLMVRAYSSTVTHGEVTTE